MPRAATRGGGSDLAQGLLGPPLSEPQPPEHHRDGAEPQPEHEPEIWLQPEEPQPEQAELTPRTLSQQTRDFNDRFPSPNLPTEEEVVIVLPRLGSKSDDEKRRKGINPPPDTGSLSVNPVLPGSTARASIARASNFAENPHPYDYGSIRRLTGAASPLQPGRPRRGSLPAELERWDLEKWGDFLPEVFFCTASAANKEKIRARYF